MLDKKKILIAVGLLIMAVALGFGGYYLLMNGQDEVKEPVGIGKPTDQGGQLPGGGEAGGEISDPAPPKGPVSEEEKSKTDAENKAKFFAAMMGSYSSDARFQNIIDLKPLMTVKMQAWADDFIGRNLTNLEKNKENVTTQVFGASIKSFSGNGATIELATRRSIITETENKIDNQTVTVELIKSGEKWLVDRVAWE